MKKVFINGTAVLLDTDNAMGKGGEADIYDLHNGFVLKVYKGPDHPDLVGLPEEQHAAENRIRQQQSKLPAYPKNLPARVIAPRDLAVTKRRAAPDLIVGFTMPFIHGAELLRYTQRGFRQGIPNNEVVNIFRDLHSLINEIHGHHVVIGDFNDLNVLVRGSAAHLIDADSFQFGPYLCATYTERFVDPLKCDPTATRPMLVKPHTCDSDWYAFAVMLMQCLLFVDPYGGIYRPKNGDKIAPLARPLHRITVFHPDVQYPKPATPYRVLPDDLLDYFHRVFVKDERGSFPPALLENIAWTTCGGCGLEHGRTVCPNCAIAAPAHFKTTVIRGDIETREVFRTSGAILRANLSANREIQWLYYENGAYRREDGEAVLTGPFIHRARYRLCGAKTLVGKAEKVAVLEPGKNVRQIAVECFGQMPVFDANTTRMFWVENGQLNRDERFGPDPIGSVLNNRTLFWTGETFGFGLYRAGGLNIAFVFDADKGGLKDTVKLPPFNGRILDATCAFGQDRVWFLMETDESGKRMHRVVVIKRDGSIEAADKAERGDASWLSSIHGACALGNVLFKPTDEGIVRVEIKHGAITKTREFPDTAAFVDSSTRLLVGADGIYAVNAKDIVLLRLKKSP